MFPKKKKVFECDQNIVNLLPFLIPQRLIRGEKGGRTSSTKRLFQFASPPSQQNACFNLPDPLLKKTVAFSFVKRKMLKTNGCLMFFIFSLQNKKKMFSRFSVGPVFPDFSCALRQCTAELLLSACLFLLSTCFSYLGLDFSLFLIGKTRKTLSKTMNKCSPR